MMYQKNSTKPKPIITFLKNELDEKYQIIKILNFIKILYFTNYIIKYDNIRIIYEYLKSRNTTQKIMYSKIVCIFKKPSKVEYHNKLVNVLYSLIKNNKLIRFEYSKSLISKERKFIYFKGVNILIINDALYLYINTTKSKYIIQHSHHIDWNNSIINLKEQYNITKKYADTGLRDICKIMMIPLNDESILMMNTKQELSY